jgi:hypothetical protein
MATHCSPRPAPAAAEVELAAPAAVSLNDALAVAGHARYHQDPVFPGCFVCGPARRPGDGLRIFPGPLPGSDLWAAPWTPDPSVADPDGLVAPAVIWAALDCPSGFAAGVGDTVMVLGRMAAQVLARPRRRHAVLPSRLARGPPAGRNQPAGSALLDAHGGMLAVAHTVWVTIPRPEPAP